STRGGIRLPRTVGGWVALIAIVWGSVVTAVGMAHLVQDDSVGPDNRPVAVLDQDFVSSETCRSCHPSNYDSWHASYHRTMTQVASPTTAATDLDGFTQELAGKVYRIFEDGDRYKVQDRETSAPKNQWNPSREIVLMTGSHNLQMYWLESGEGRSMEPFPFAYNIKEDRWAPAHDTFLLPPEFGAQVGHHNTIGEWNQACMDCHTTHARPRFVDGLEFDSHVVEFGISCEACHSGGEEHIAANRNPLRRYAKHLSEEGDDTMVDPMKLDGPRATLACGQCHSIWGFRSLEDKLAWNREGTQFAPGDDKLVLRWMMEPTMADATEELRQELQTYNAGYFDNRFWSDGMVRVTGREMNGVVESPCFEGGEYSCMSCHEMHPDEPSPEVLDSWRAGQMRTDHGNTNQDCLQCHETIEQDIAAHTFHAPESVGSNCYDCHMPHTSYGLLRGVRSHQVSSPTSFESIETGRPNACNLCRLDETLEWTADHLKQWYGQEKPEFEADDRNIAAAVNWLLKGDAGQRAVVTWNMSRPEAQAASGTDWMYPVLSLNLNDPYAAVRFITHATLRDLPGMEDFEYEYVGDESVTRPRVKVAYEKWFNEIKPRHLEFEPSTLLQPNGLFQPGEVARLLNLRDDRPIFLAE
ncbi:cytochrome c3 family protein, partial [Opitutaceae bacterium]|nr:cytochrome c3 family protein [Opitutaceae bacterium]